MQIGTKKIKIKIKSGTQNGQVVKIRGKGAGEKDGHRGDLYSTIQIDIPTRLSRKKLFTELRELEN